MDISLRPHPSGSRVFTVASQLPFLFPSTRCLEALLEYEAKVEAANIDGRTPLFLALLNGKKECAKKLFEATTNLDFISAVCYIVTGNCS